MPPLRVNIVQGDIEGCVRRTLSGFEYNSYLGIPYAKAPVGELRFRDPVPHEGWKGVRQAQTEAGRFIQIDKLFTMQMIGDEDGLFLNVYTPADAEEGCNLPVMAWIHGGGYIMGAANEFVYGPDYLLEKNVIFVSFNFRLGALGFLCLNTPEVPGNAGLKDQQLALRWIKENIGKFGGDRNNVTVFGVSAGSACVQLHVLSESSKGLVDKAIMESGSCLNSWSIKSNPEESARALAKNLGFNSNDKQEILKFLRSLPANKIVTEVSNNFKLVDKHHFIPVVEKVFSGVQGFITEHPLQLILTGKFNKVPLMAGITSQEGLYFLLRGYYGDADISKFNKIEDFGNVADGYLPEVIRDKGPDYVKSFIEKLTKYYFKKGEPVIEGYIDMIGDIGIAMTTNLSVRLMRAHLSPIYYYKFSYNGSQNFFKAMVNYRYKGACHVDELGYIFKQDIQEVLRKKYNCEIDEETKPTDILMQKRMVEMWTNFAKFGDPTVKLTEAVTTKWLPVTKDRVNCMEIDKDLKMIAEPYSDRMNFWAQLLKEEEQNMK